MLNIGKINLNKKSEVHNVMVFIIVSFVVVLLIIFGIVTIRNIIGVLGDYEMVSFVEELTEDIKMISTKKSVKVATYDVPESVKKIVFLDMKYRHILLDNPFVQQDPILYDAVETNQKINMFLYDSDNKLIKGFYIGDIELGQFGSETCTGVGVIEVHERRAEIRITKKPGLSLFLGEDCEGLKYAYFSYPDFDDSIFPGLVKKAEIVDGNKIRIKLDQTTGRFFNISLFNTTLLDINSSEIDRLHRFYYRIETPEDSEIKFRIGFLKSSNKKWIFYGSDMTARDELDPGYYYTENGRFIPRPGFEFDDVKVEATMLPSFGRKLSPALRNVIISYFE